MVDEPENLVLVQLREVRAELLGIRTKLEEHDGRFDQIDKRFDDVHLLVNHGLGTAAAAHVKGRELDARQGEAETRQRRTDEQFAEIERRLRKVEEETDS